MTDQVARSTGAPAPTRIGVAGCGLIGGSILRALAGFADVTLAGFDSDPQVRRSLDDAGIQSTSDVETLARESDIVVVCAPPAFTAELVACALTASPDVIVTDVASVKTGVVGGVVDRVGQQVAHDRYVPGHPLAGRERHGFGAARADLFDGSVWALCPSPETPLDAFLAVCRLVWSLGANVLTIDAPNHDVAVAFSSHAPHILASAIAQAPPADRQFAVGLLSGGGLRDATRVAASDGALWVQIIDANRVATLAALDAQQASIALLRDAVERQDWDGLRGHWAKGQVATEALLAARWMPRVWSTIVLADPSVEAFLEFGQTGRLVRAATFDGAGDLRLEVAAPARTRP